VLLGEFTWGNTEKTHRGYTPTGRYGPPVSLRFDPILDADTFDHPQVALARTAIRSRRGNEVHPLSGRLHSPCGSDYGGVRRKDPGLRQYLCHRRKWTATGVPRCADVRLAADEVEDRVWDAVSALLKDPDKILALAQDYLGLRRGQVAMEHDELAAVWRTISRLVHAQGETLPELLARGLPADQIEAAVSRIAQDLTQAREREAQLERWRADSREQSRIVRSAWDLAETAAARLATMTRGQKSEVIRLLDVLVHVLDGSRSPALRIEGSLCNERLLDAFEPGNPEVAGTPRRGPRRRPVVTGRIRRL
jgi:hypothetical protein